MIEKGLCECGCGGKTARHARALIPGTGKINKFIKGHNKNNAARNKAVMILGHPIPKGVQVHHHRRPGVPGRGIKDIVICENQQYHRFLHMREKIYWSKFDISKWTI